MRIAIFTDNFHPEISGITDTILVTTDELAKQGHKILIIAPQYSTKDYRIADTKKLILHKNIRIKRLPSLAFKTGTKQGRMVIPLGISFNIIKRFDPDIIHVHLPFGTGIEGLLASKKYHIPLIGTNHTPIKEFLRYSPIRTKTLETLLNSYNTWFYNRCNFFSSPSSSIFKSMGRIKTSYKKIPNSIPKIKVLKKRHTKNFVILYSGRIAKEKNIDIIIKAIAKIKHKIPNIKLIITGIGNEKEKLEKLAIRLKINIEFTGFVSKKQLSIIYSKADVFVIMSTSDTQSLAMMQAMQNAIPVISSNSWGLKEYNKTGILLKPHDIHSLAKNIFMLYKNKKKRQQIGIQGKKSIKQLSPGIIAQKWNKIYETQKTLKK